MSEALYPYYERELHFIRQMAQEFGQRYPSTAGRLMLEPNASGDPHIERLIESFALLSGRIHRKLDDEFPELTDALLGVLYPHYLSPIPSMSIVQFELDPTRGRLPDGFLIDTDSRLRTAPVNGTACRFRTAYPTTLWPLKINNAILQTPPLPREYDPPRRTAAALRLQFESLGGTKFADLSLDTLRLYLFGDGYITATLYELLFNHATQVVFRSTNKNSKIPNVTLPASEVLRPVGFDSDQGLLPYSARSFIGYRLLTEFFTFREKFLFVDLGGWQKACAGRAETDVEVVIYLDRAVPRMEEWVDATTFRLGCAPAVNLFEQIAEPISLTQKTHEYRIVPDVTQPLGLETHSVTSVSSTDPTTGTVTEYQPFYSFNHRRDREDEQSYWYTTRRNSTREGDRGTDLYLHLVDLNFRPHLPAESTLVVRTMATNRDLPVQLAMAGERLYFELEAAAPLSGIRCLRPPTTPLRPPSRHGRYWALISHLNLNYLSLTDPERGRESLQEILRLYDFSDPKAGQQQLSEVTRQTIDGITALRTRRIVGRTGGAVASGFARGVEVSLELDEEKYVGTGMYLFASVLERFLGLYTSINSFTQVVAKTTQTENYFKRWPLRAGDQQLV